MCGVGCLARRRYRIKSTRDVGSSYPTARPVVLWLLCVPHGLSGGRCPSKERTMSKNHFPLFQTSAAVESVLSKSKSPLSAYCRTARLLMEHAHKVFLAPAPSRELRAEGQRIFGSLLGQERRALAQCVRVGQPLEATEKILNGLTTTLLA